MSETEYRPNSATDYNAQRTPEQKVQAEIDQQKRFQEDAKRRGVVMSPINEEDLRARLNAVHGVKEQQQDQSAQKEQQNKEFRGLKSYIK